MHRLTALCVRSPRLTLLGTLVLLAFAGYSAYRAELLVGIHANIGADHPSVRELEAFLDTFGGGYPVLIAYECARPEACRGALDPPALAMAHAVARSLEPSRHVTRVTSLATTPLLVPGSELGLEARRLFSEDGANLDPALRQLALSDEVWRGALLSADGRVGAIAVELAETASSSVVSVMEEIRSALAPHEERFRFYVVGEPAIWMAAHEDSTRSMLRVGVGTGGALFVVLWLLLRSLPAVFASLVTIGVTSAFALGAVPWLGWQRTELTSGATTTVLVLGCADCIHFVTHYLETRCRHRDAATALVATSRWVLAPCLLTSATSAGAFLCLAAGDLFSLVQFGSIAALGVALAFFLTFTLLPALLVLLPVAPRSPHHSAAWHGALAALARFGARNARRILAVALAVGALGAAGLSRLSIELGVTQLWGDDHPLIRGIQFVGEHLEGATRLELAITLPPGQPLEAPGVVEQLREVEGALGRVDGVGTVRSISTLLVHADSLLRGDAANDGAALATGELMTLVSSGDPGALDAWLSFDQNRLRISAEVEPTSTTEQLRILGEARRVLDRMLPSGWSAGITGTVVLVTQMQADFGLSQTTIVSASSAIVFVLIAVYLRSLTWALLAMIPNAIALLLLYGTMGLLGFPIEYGSAICAPIAIGIAADDTIHFLTAYARERRAGLDALAALPGAIAGVGEAVVTTSSALALGFLSLAASPFASITTLGILGALSIVAATLADLLVLPALIATAARARSHVPALRDAQPTGNTTPPTPL
jgi:hypothetical protein